MKTFSEAVLDSINETLENDELTCDQIFDLMQAKGDLQNYDEGSAKSISQTDSVLAALLRFELRQRFLQYPVIFNFRKGNR